MVRRAAALVLVALTLAVGGASSAAAEPAGLSAVPFGFKVPASHGWSAQVLGGMNPKTGEGAVQIMLRRGGALAFYATKDVTFTESTVSADFGALGRIEVHSVPTGGTTTDRSACGGRPVTFPAGRWEGTISFHGEEGFTDVEASSAAGDLAGALNLLCAAEVNEGIGGHSPGALLTVERRHGSESLAMTVRKNRRVGPSRYYVEIGEYRAGMFIIRSLEGEAGSGAFDFEIPPGRAKVRLPRPFSGALSFVRAPRSKATATGDLSVDLPGRADVPILGPGKAHASLVRAVLNPSHPF